MLRTLPKLNYNISEKEIYLKFSEEPSKNINPTISYYLNKSKKTIGLKRGGHKRYLDFPSKSHKVQGHDYIQRIDKVLNITLFNLLNSPCFCLLFSLTQHFATFA